METPVRSLALAAVAALFVAAAVSPVSAQNGDAVQVRPLLPLHVDIGRFTAVGEASFGAGNDTTQTVEGWAGQGFQTIAMMPRDDLALCSGLTIHYASGDTEPYPLLTPGLLSQDQIYEIVPTGNASEISSIDASCHARAGEVTIGFYGMAGPVFTPMRTEAAATHNAAGAIGDD